VKKAKCGKAVLDSTLKLKFEHVFLENSINILFYISKHTSYYKVYFNKILVA
jgi:hypothetical protein